MSRQARAAGTVSWVAAFMAGITAAIALAWSQDADLQATRNAAQALFEEKETRAAVAIFEEITRSPEVTAADWMNYAIGLYELGSDGYDGVLRALDAAHDLEPTHAGPFYLRGLVHSRRGEHELAAEQFRSAAEIDSTDAAVLYNWAASLQDLDRVDDALTVYDRVTSMGFDVAQQFFVSSLYRAGRALAVRDGVEAARPYITRYQEYQRRLSQAQRAPTALEAGRYKRIVVPRVNLAPAAVATGLGLEFLPAPDAVDSVGPAVLVDDLGEGTAVLVGDAGGAAGTLRPLGGASAYAVGGVGGPAALGDFDRDGHADILVTGSSTMLLRRVPEADLSFAPTATVGMPATDHANDVAWLDADHDGDLDVLVADAQAGLRWIANLGGGEFEELTESAGLGGDPARQVAWADFDDDNDVDIVVADEAGAVRLFTNVRERRFEEIAAAVGAAGSGSTRIVRAADMDNDGWFDLVLAGDTLRLLVNQGDGTFRPGFEWAGEATHLELGDLNNDGWLDLIVGGGGTLINDGAGNFAEGRAGEAGSAVRAVVDHDGDGALDLLIETDGELRWHAQPGPAAGWLRVALSGVKTNIRGIGTSVEVKVGGLYQRRQSERRWVHVGIGANDTADVVRLTWPNGIIQNETVVAANRELGPIGEVERLEGSCPLLYTWDGSEWRFINEVLGVAPLGMPLAAGVIHPADFDEYVPIPGAAMQPRDGFYEVRLTEELREAGYLDTVRLLAVDHPVGTEVFPDERFVPPPHPEFGVYTVAAPLEVVARDQGGADWSAALTELDGNRARPFEPYLYEGLATEHSLELLLPEAAAGPDVRLFLTGWVYWATGSINLQVDDDPRVEFAPVALDVPNGRGGWREAIADIGLPNAKNSTLVVELDEHLDPGDPRVRLRTSMRLYWDRAFYTVGEGSVLSRPVGSWQAAWSTPQAGELGLAPADGAVRIQVLAPESADIRWRGFSGLQRDADGFETFEYATVSQESNWNQHRGSYTRYGAVDELLEDADDRLVIIGTGDEVAVRFPADLAPPRPGWQRDWLLYLNGWVKDGDLNTLGSERVEPLPTHAMSVYPAGVSGTDESESDWQARYNTRPARSVNAPLRPRR